MDKKTLLDSSLPNSRSREMGVSLQHVLREITQGLRITRPRVAQAGKVMWVFGTLQPVHEGAPEHEGAPGMVHATPAAKAIVLIFLLAAVMVIAFRSARSTQAGCVYLPDGTEVCSANPTATPTPTGTGHSYANCYVQLLADRRLLLSRRSDADSTPNLHTRTSYSYANCYVQLLADRRLLLSRRSDADSTPNLHTRTSYSYTNCYVQLLADRRLLLSRRSDADSTPNLHTRTPYSYANCYVQLLADRRLLLSRRSDADSTPNLHTRTPYSYATEHAHDDATQHAHANTLTHSHPIGSVDRLRQRRRPPRGGTDSLGQCDS